MTIYERDEDGGEEQDEASSPIVNAFNACGVTQVCIGIVTIY